MRSRMRAYGHKNIGIHEVSMVCYVVSKFSMNVQKTDRQPRRADHSEEYNEKHGHWLIWFFKNPSSCVYSVDLESFTAKNYVMDSGINTKNTTLRLNMTFRAATDRDRREWGDACVIRFYCLYDMFLSIDNSNRSVFNKY